MVNLEALYREFVNESRRLLEEAETSILRLEQGGTSGSIDEIFRAIHTIKGNSGLFEAGPVTAFAHEFESLLSRLRESSDAVDTDTIDLLLRGVDTLRTLIGSGGDQRADADTLTRAMRERARPGVKTGEPAPGGGALRVPARFVRDAQARSACLSVVFVDLAAQKFTQLGEVWELIGKWKAAGQLLMHGPRPEKMLRADSVLKATLPYYFLLLTVESPEQFLATHDLRFSSIKVLHGLNGYGRNGNNGHNGHAPVAKTEHTAVERGGPNGAAARATAGEDTHLNVPIVLIDKLMNLAGETVVARNELLQKIAGLLNPELTQAGKKVGALISRLQEYIMRSRLQELRGVFQRFPRIVRDVCQATGKTVNLRLSGGHVELDKNVIDVLLEAMLHMIRNAVDHGIESAADRERAGKAPAGELSIQAELRAGHVILTIADDGRGLDTAAIQARGVERGLIEADSRLTEAEIHELIFAPGFSTARGVSTTSGRGVGMDIVRNSLKRVGGSIEVNSVPGRGTTFTAKIPQTLSIFTCMIVRSGADTCAIAQQNIAELIRIDPAQRSKSGENEVYHLRGQLLPIFSLRRALAAKEGVRDEGPAGADAEGFLIVVRSDRYQFGIAVEEILNPEEIVVKPLGLYFHGQSLFSGAAVAGSGQAILILDMTGFAGLVRLQPQENLSAKTESAARVETERFLMIRASGQIFALPAGLNPRVEAVGSNGIRTTMGQATIVFQDALVPVLLPGSLYGLPVDERPGYVIYFDIDGRRTGIAAAQILNLAEGVTVETDRVKGPFIAGHFLVGLETAIVLDVAALVRSAPEQLDRDFALSEECYENTNASTNV